MLPVTLKDVVDDVVGNEVGNGLYLDERRRKTWQEPMRIQHNNPSPYIQGFAKPCPHWLLLFYPPSLKRDQIAPIFNPLHHLAHGPVFVRTLLVITHKISNRTHRPFTSLFLPARLFIFAYSRAPTFLIIMPFLLSYFTIHTPSHTIVSHYHDDITRLIPADTNMRRPHFMTHSFTLLTAPNLRSFDLPTFS
jgi:hypothetical protein